MDVQKIEGDVTTGGAQSRPLSYAEGAAWLAGEASGDFLASLVLPEVARRMDMAPQFGVGGEKMIAAGLESWYPASRLSVRGYVEVLKKLPGILLLRRAMIKRVTDVNPRVFIGVDAPDFNLGVEAKLKAQGIPTVHFVSPSIWAWRPERIHKIRAAVNRMLLVFPFEEEIQARRGARHLHWASAGGHHPDDAGHPGRTTPSSS